MMPSLYLLCLPFTYDAFPLLMMQNFLTYDNNLIYLSLCYVKSSLLTSDGIDIEPKAKRSFDPLIFFDIEAKQNNLFQNFARTK